MKAAARLFPQPQPPPPPPETTKRQGESNLHQSSYNDSNHPKSVSSSVPESSRRVSFASHSDHSKPTINITTSKEGQPKRSRWGDKLQVKSAPSATQQKNDKSTETNADSPTTSILRKVDRSATQAGPTPQHKFITKKTTSSEALTTTIERKRNDSQSNKSTTATAAYLKATLLTNKLGTIATPMSGGDNSKAKPSNIMPKEFSIATSEPMITLPREATSICSKPKFPNIKSIIKVDHPRATAVEVHNVFPKSPHSLSIDKQIHPVPNETNVKPSELLANATTPTTSELPKTKVKKAKKKKMKQLSPFRAKVGCVVTVRFRKLSDGGNPNIVWVVKDGDSFRVKSDDDATTTSSKQADGDGTNNGDAKYAIEKTYNTPSLLVVDDANSEPAQGRTRISGKQGGTTKRKPKPYEIWSSPIPGKDDGLSLLGSWIKCILPQPTTIEDNHRNAAIRTPKRALEGNVISIGKNECNESGIKVVLLVDRKDIESHSNLHVLEDKKLVDDATTSSSELRMRALEAKIRGENKVAVQVTLASTFDQRKGSKPLDPDGISQWAVRKRVIAKPAGKKPTKNDRQQNKRPRVQSLFVGDGDDTQYQQMKNWEWIASRASSSCQRPRTGQDTDLAVLETNMRDSVTQLVGEVVQIDKSPSTAGSTTIATVTIKRLWTPEQLDGGRLPHHGPLELFDTMSNTENEMYFQAPIEDLIVVGNRIHRLVDAWKQSCVDNNIPDDGIGWNFTVTHSYQAGDNTLTPLRSAEIEKNSLKVCHYCQRSYHDSQLRKCQHHNSNNMGGPLWCTRCLELKGVSLSSVDETTWTGPCCMDKCDCSHCSTADRNTTMDTKTQSSCNTAGLAFADLLTSLQSIPCKDFILPKSVGQLSLRPSFAPIVGEMRSKLYGKETTGEKDMISDKIRGKRIKRVLTDTGSKNAKKSKATLDSQLTADDTGEKFCNAECIRAVSFGQLPKRYWGSSKLTHASFLREQQYPRAIKIGKAEEKTALSGRAARASQRRMIKSLAALGDASKSVDRLAGRDREHQLRFDKSTVHGWGVYAEEQINSGDLIIEYR